jgi:hypothetical protein
MIELALESGSAILSGATGTRRTVDVSEADVLELMSESSDGMCCKPGGSRHRTSGALTSFGVLRGRMGERTRIRSGLFARSSFVTTSAVVQLVNGEVVRGAWLSAGFLTPSLELCAESLRGAMTDNIADMLVVLFRG